MYKTLLLIFLSIILSSCFKNNNIDTKQWDNLIKIQEKINYWVEDENINWWWWWIPSNQALKR